MQGGDRVIATFAVPRASLAGSAVDVFVTRPSDTSLLPRVGFFVNNTRALRPLLATPPLPTSYCWPPYHCPHHSLAPSLFGCLCSGVHSRQSLGCALACAFCQPVFVCLPDFNQYLLISLCIFQSTRASSSVGASSLPGCLSAPTDASVGSTTHSIWGT
jgi:hypothetical protein